MPTEITTQAIKRARQFRRSMTDGEKKLWAELKQFRQWYGIHARKQVPLGPYTVDFAIHAHRLVIEVDGEHHFTPSGLRRDAARDAWLRNAGYRVLRFTTGEISDEFDGCVEQLLSELAVTRRFSPVFQGVAHTPANLAPT
ncbi:endonuclease domain-containing protein [Tianweitania populi]|uniref:Endonuclease n=1 Tax=Tianweitania populi TaxID=1607949 RepID=A0A8J3GK54_9HYPH|nr:endonuclease domain-containing protein [Tianweitania populi]GHD11139.1 endonuclease [Tianweitania populi]